MTQPIIRQARVSDIQFLTSSWLKSYRNAAAVRGVPNSVYFFYHHKLLEELLSRCTVLIYCYPDNQDQILGYVCAEVFDSALVVHYAYVKKTFRRLGIAKALIKHLVETEEPPAVLYTHKTKDIYPLERDLKEKGWLFHPYMLWVSLPDKWEER